MHCDKVVYPGACVDRACPFVYAYQEWGRTYVGCMQKVYAVEIDLELLDEARGRKGGFGAVRAMRQPLPMCRAEVSSCYQHRADERGCVNPEFFELPAGRRPSGSSSRATRPRSSRRAGVQVLEALRPRLRPGP